ncbi:hypothetical protein AGMMS49545_09920 [Betaproteobacteria bacterium]|nr:hypothetical protein AGMMS49545_09920 [Betaproteobacteria bacterium]GHU42577.1 hypothetical protein AGMMS50289_07510 [Betaproteobacteria bacterium]
MASRAEKKYFSHPAWSHLGDTALVLSVLLAGTVFPRLLLLGGMPYVDDGYYAFISQWIHHGIVNGQGIPDTGLLSLYPMLCSWVFYFDYSPIISLRFIDLGAAVLAALFLYKLLERESGSKAGAALLLLVFTFTMNQIDFIDFGFKNSITIALVPLFWAICIGQKILQEKRSDVNHKWWMAGALTALAVIFRETFIPFAALGFVVVFIAHGKKSAFNFFMGGIVTGILIIGSILIARGGVTETIEAYRGTASFFNAVAKENIKIQFLFAGLETMKLSAVAMLLSALAFFVLSVIAVLRRSKRILSGLLFWLSLAGVALIEPATKFGFSYHFAVALPGLAGLCALALREAIRAWKNSSWANKQRGDAIALSGVMLCVIWFSLESYPLARSGWPITLETLMLAPDGEWPDQFMADDNLLIAADEIKKVIPENGTLSINRNLEVFYPFIRHLPPSMQLANLSSLGFRLNFSVPHIKEALLACAPDVILMNEYDDWQTGYGNEQLFAAILASEIYEGVWEMRFPGHSPENYVTVVIFRKTKETVCLAP